MTNVVALEHGDATLLLAALEGWEIGSWNDAKIVLWDPTWRSSFRANVVISCHSTEWPHDVRHLLEVATEEVQARYRYVESLEAVVLDEIGSCALAQLVLFDAGPAARRLAQLHVFVDAGDLHTGDLGSMDSRHVGRRPVFQIVGTVAAEDLAHYADAFERLVRSMVIELPTRQ